MMPQDTMLLLSRMAHLTTGPFNAAKIRLQQVDHELAKLDGRTCTGSTWWRDKDTPGKQPKMYIIHRKNQACPVHGRPDRGKRIRVYIGSGDDEQLRANALLSAEGQRSKLQATQQRLHNGLSQATYQLRRYYEALGYSTPTDPAQYPEPHPHARW